MADPIANQPDRGWNIEWHTFFGPSTYPRWPGVKLWIKMAFLLTMGLTQGYQYPSVPVGAYRNYIKPVPPTYNFVLAPLLGLTGWYWQIQKIPVEINLPEILSGKLQSGRFVNFTKANPLKYGFPSSIPSSHSRKPYCASSLLAC